MLIKAGVDISRLERNARLGLQKVSDVYEANGSEIVISSTYEGNHGAGSLHYAHRAFDVYPPVKHKEHVIILCIKVLGKDFDVVPKSNHVHFEYDPASLKALRKGA